MLVVFEICLNVTSQHLIVLAYSRSGSTECGVTEPCQHWLGQLCDCNVSITLITGVNIDPGTSLEQSFSLRFWAACVLDAVLICWKLTWVWLLFRSSAMQQRNQWDIQYQKCGSTKPLHQVVYGMLTRLPFKTTKWNPTIRPPRYDHLVITTTCFWPELHKLTLICVYSYFQSPVNPTTPLIWPKFHGLMVVVLTGFHCTCYDNNNELVDNIYEIK